MDSTGEHPLKKLGPKSAVCSVCKMIGIRLQGKVVRKIKGKMKEAKKRELVAEHLPKVCAESAYPDQMAVIERNGEGQVYVDFADAMEQGDVSIKVAGQVVTRDVIAACKHTVEVELKGALVEKLVSKPKHGADVEITDWLCGRSQLDVCDMDEDPEDLEDSADEDL
eukprot:gnl/TRDRNA2_/TRDRNA2_45587_c0_seq1.p1 gnl/TRDRNA2_/TRDRNA2_45587_c0~~gnl/TRDRNA2_/TRDRNA2_45587_c0_seq1.p1  ORF type:complete len:191 (-),score=47.16 gnl/TRDRNA2_/TRDRNA2_45587_c0_seq1:162-662(-)